METLLLPVLLREITNSALERRLFTWFINEYVEYFDDVGKGSYGVDVVRVYLETQRDKLPSSIL
jgi:hypothetical protein